VVLRTGIKGVERLWPFEKKPFSRDSKIQQRLKTHTKCPFSTGEYKINIDEQFEVEVSIPQSNEIEG
jgi:hypothetical protein